MLNPKAAPPPLPYEAPEIGSAVHYFDEQKFHGSRQGSGPYAAQVVALTPAGVSLIVGTAQGSFNVDRISHHKVLDHKTPGRKKWWQWPAETRKGLQDANAAEKNNAEKR